MDDEIRAKLISVLNELTDMLKCEDCIIAPNLKRLNNDLLREASLFQNRQIISLTVIVYSLHKIFSHNSDIEKKSILEKVQQVKKTIGNDAQFATAIRKLSDHIKKFDKDMTDHILQTIKHAQIVNGLKIYEAGLSIAQSAESLGVSRWDIMEYLGKRNIIDDDNRARIDVKSRLHFARGLFK